jgi:hypothetical protein
MINKIESFKEIAPKIFKPLVDNYGYALEEIKVNKLNGQDWSIHFIYFNVEKNLKIIIKQEPYYTDYGFSFFVYKIDNGQYNILYNVEHHLQDDGNLFLTKAAEDLFSTEVTRDIISGKNWKELNYIPFLLVVTKSRQF